MAEGGQEIVEEVGDGNIQRVDSTNFLKLQKIIIDIGGPTLRNLLQKLATADRDDVQQFSEFLNMRSVRCELFQLRKQEMICCICKGDIFLNKLKDWQWEKLYKMLGEKNCYSETRLSLNKHCCVHVAVAGVLDKLDVSLMCLILTNLSDFNENEPLMDMITRIRNYRNELSHLGTTEKEDDEFEFQCRDIRNILRELVNVCGDRNMLDQVFSQIDDVKRMEIAHQDRDELQSFMESYKRVLSVLKTFSTGPLGDLQQLQSLRSDENAMELMDELIERMDAFLHLMLPYLRTATNAMEKTKERHEKPQNIPDKTKKDSSLQNVSQEKTTFDKNLAAMAEIEQKLKDLTNALYSKVKEDKPYKLTEKKENISSPRTVVQDKAISDQKLSTVQNKAEQIGHNLRNLAQALYTNAKQVLPTELHTVLSEGRDAIAEKLEEEYDEVTRKPKTVHYMAISQFPKERRIVWALEIGDTYTSFAFSLDAAADIHLGINESRFLSNKTSTVILLDAKGEFISFGCEAEDGYARIMEEEQQESYYLFKSFPKVLRACMKPGRSIKITDEGGKTLDAKLVFALSVKHFVGMLLRKLENPLLKITMDDVNLVITIPAIPGDTVSKFVIDAVKEAGINKDQVITVLEPVAASVYGQREESYNSKDECFSLTFGKKYLLVDLGGDSTRITVNIKAERDEVISMTFCPWGGNSVNETFFTILEDAVGTRVLDLLKTTDAESYLDLLRNFEIAKRKFSPGSSLIEVTFPLTLANIFKAEHNLSFEEAFSDPRFGKWMSVHQNQLAMTGEQFGKLFRPTLNAVKRYIKDVLKKGENKDISNILMVGGFSRCELVTKEIVEEFKTHKVFIPKEPDLAILKGAVFCGRIPYAMKDNVHKYTFGVQSWPEFDSKIHPIDKKVMIEGTARCRDCFTKFAQKGDHVEVGKKITMLFLALEPEADVLVCELYASDKSEPQFTSECTLQATLSIKLPKTKPENLIIEESFCFGETELQVQARDIYLKPYTVMCSINEMTIRE